MSLSLLIHGRKLFLRFWNCQNIISTLQLQKLVDMYFHDNISDGKPEDILGAATYWGEVVLFLEVL